MISDEAWRCWELNLRVEMSHEKQRIVNISCKAPFSPLRLTLSTTPLISFPRPSSRTSPPAYHSNSNPSLCQTIPLSSKPLLINTPQNRSTATSGSTASSAFHVPPPLSKPVFTIPDAISRPPCLCLSNQPPYSCLSSSKPLLKLDKHNFPHSNYHPYSPPSNSYSQSSGSQPSTNSATVPA